MTTRKSDESTCPSFSVSWNGTTTHFDEDIYCCPPANGSAPSRCRKTVAILESNIAYLEVSDVVWEEPTDISFVSHRLAFSLLISTWGLPIEYSYEGELKKPSRAGQVMVILPDREIHSRNGPGSIRTVTCSFEPSFVESIVGLSNFSQLEPRVAIDVSSAVISSLLLRLMHEAIHPSHLSKSIFESFAQAMLVEYAHCLMRDMADDSGGGLTARHFAAIEECLSDLSGGPPSVAKLAAACGLSERYFARLFREQTNCSAAQYIKSVQIMKAKAYLLETDIPLKEIAYRLGFSSAANFSSAFRAATGFTPGFLRKS